MESEAYKSSSINGLYIEGKHNYPLILKGGTIRETY